MQIVVVSVDVAVVSPAVQTIMITDIQIEAKE